MSEPASRAQRGHSMISVYRFLSRPLYRTEIMDIVLKTQWSR